MYKYQLSYKRILTDKFLKDIRPITRWFKVFSATLIDYIDYIYTECT